MSHHYMKSRICKWGKWTLIWKNFNQSIRDMIWSLLIAHSKMREERRWINGRTVKQKRKQGLMIQKIFSHPRYQKCWRCDGTTCWGSRSQGGLLEQQAKLKAANKPVLIATMNTRGRKRYWLTNVPLFSPWKVIRSVKLIWDRQGESTHSLSKSPEPKASAYLWTHELGSREREKGQEWNGTKWSWEKYLS